VASRPPQNTDALRARLQPLLGPMGITRIAHIGGLDILGLPVAQAVRPLSRSLMVAQGKGATRSAAEVSAILEAAETWHAERKKLAMAVGSHRALTVRLACPPLASLPTYAGEAADPDQPYRWVLAQDLAAPDGEGVLVPYDLVHTAFTPAHDDVGSPFYRSTSGLAAGIEREAVLEHAICEVIERDAAVRVGRAARGAMPVALRAVTDRATCALLERAGKAGLSIALWLLPHPTGVPVAYAVLSGDGGRLQGSQSRFGGYGCALCSQEAIRGAVFEAAQSRLTVIAGARDDLVEGDYARSERRVEAQSGEDGHSHVTPSWPGGVTHLPELVQRLVDAGYHQVLAVDLSHREIGLQVWRVIIPGLDPSVTPGDCARLTGGGV